MEVTAGITRNLGNSATIIVFLIMKYIIYLQSWNW